jgi:hypothetical protein
MKKILLITIFFSSVSFSQHPHFETGFIFTDEFNNSQELILGYDPFGTDSLDPHLGEVIVPQVPFGQFGVRFQFPSDTSLYTIKDIRFGCGQPFFYEHLIDLSYQTASDTIHVFWNWFLLVSVEFKNPYDGTILAHFEIFTDSTHFIIPSALQKLTIGILYDGPLAWPEYEVTSPNGGETIEGGKTYTINWWNNQLAPMMDIEFTSDSGQTWELIEDSIWTWNMSYDWHVPLIKSTNCLIRIGGYPCAHDQSDSFFTITYPVRVQKENELPTEFYLYQNYPNPFNPTTKIKFTIPSVETTRRVVSTTLKVYDVLGNEVATLVNEERPPGEYEVEFTVGQSASADSPDIASGVYFYQLKTGDFIETKKMVLIR